MPSCGLNDNIKMDTQEAGWGDMDWISLAQDRKKWRALVNVVMNLRVEEGLYRMRLNIYDK
jgi:hypothetical protein